MTNYKAIDYALFYALRGLYVFPVEHKRPLVKWGTDATTDSEQVKQWWTDHPEWGIGIATGKKSGIVVVDIDPGKSGAESLLSLIVEHGNLPDTPESLTGGGGRHLIFKHPGEGVKIKNSASDLGPGIDIRGDGGYIVAPPTLHESGKRYEWEPMNKLSSIPIAELPSWLYDMTVDRPETQREYHPTCDLPDQIPNGLRNATLTSLAGTMRRRGMSTDAIFQALMVENTRRCVPPLSPDELSRISKSVGRYPPTAPPAFSGDQEEIPVREPMDAFTVGSAFMDLLENLEGRSIKVYIGGIDSSLGGLERQTLTVLAARPSMGKTTLAWQMARNVAASGFKAMFFSLEMSATSLWAKAACGAAGVRWRDVRNGTATPEQLQAIYDQTEKLMQEYADTLLVDDGVNTTETIYRVVEKHRPDLVVVDHIRYVADRGENENKRLGMITQLLKEIAKSFNCSVLALSQLNRNLENHSRENKRPTLADLRDSGEIEENADMVLMLYSEDYYNPTPKPLFITEVLVRKFRDDVLNQNIKLSFDLQHQWFNGTNEVKVNLSQPQFESRYPKDD
jgi:KaiC/GvpD/RAD55 family RecA-like ATPase